MAGTATASSTETGGRREQILEAALRLIGREGREGITHRAVAQEAGVPLGSTTYYFDSRDDLLGQALEEVIRRDTERIEGLREELSAAGSAERLAGILARELVAMVGDRSLFIGEYELWLEAARRPELRDSARTWCATEQRVLTAALEQLGSSDPATDARLLVAALDGLGEQVLAADDPVGTARRLRPGLFRLIERLVAG
jgi:TetR/AcrR family transcriptional regulator, regulator of biofilm formation and stress response